MPQMERIQVMLDKLLCLAMKLQLTRRMFSWHQISKGHNSVMTTLSEIVLPSFRVLMKKAETCRDFAEPDFPIIDPITVTARYS